MRTTLYATECHKNISWPKSYAWLVLIYISTTLYMKLLSILVLQYRNLRQTYIHNWPLQLLQSGLLTQFLTPLMLFVLILYIRGRTYSLKSTPNDSFVEKLSMAILFTLWVFARYLLRINNFDYTSYRPAHYPPDYGDFIEPFIIMFWTSTGNVIQIFTDVSRSQSQMLKFFWLTKHWIKPRTIRLSDQYFWKQTNGC